MPQTYRRSFIGFGRAIRLVRAIQRAVKITLLAPAHVVRDDKVQFAVAIIIDPRSAGGKLIRPQHSSDFGDFGKCAVAVVVKKMALSQRSDEYVIETVIVVITDRRSHTEHRYCQPCLPGHVGKSSIAIVMV